MQRCLFANSPRGKDLINLLSLLLERSQTFQMGNLGGWHQRVLQWAWWDCSRQMGWLLFSSEVRASWEEWGEGGRGVQKREQLCWGCQAGGAQSPPQGNSGACVSGTGIRRREDAAGGGGSGAPRHVPVILQTVCYLRMRVSSAA